MGSGCSPEREGLPNPPTRGVGPSLSEAHSDRQPAGTPDYSPKRARAAVSSSASR